jgi:hypothetical protein
MKKNLSIFLKFLTAFIALGGVVLAFIDAQADGYSHWTRRLLYFTTQSNVWIGITELILAFYLLSHANKNDYSVPKFLYILKYVFTVCIALTGIFFCAFLGPNADPSYRPWSFSSILNHAVTPVLAIVDFFVDRQQIKLRYYHVLSAMIPPLLYMISTGFLGELAVDFGRGTPYPYFFMYYHSPAGIFGFSSIRPFYVGSFYWILALALLVLLIGLILAFLHNRLNRRKHR